MARRKTLRRGAGRSNRPGVEGLESRQLLAVTLVQQPLPSAADNPTSIVRGPDNNLYFTVPAVVVNSVPNPVASIGVINPFTKAVFEFPTPNPTSNLGSIISGPNGGLWFADNNNITHTAAIGVLVPSTHAIGETPITITGVTISGLAAGPDNNLYFTDATNSAIGQFNPITGTVIEYPLPKANLSPSLLVADNSGNLWFAISTGVGEYNTTTHAISTFTLPSNGTVVSETLGADGNVYFNEAVAVPPVIGRLPIFVNMLASINPASGATKEYGRISSGGITTGADGNIWFVTGEANPTTGVISTYPLPQVIPNNSNLAIATGPDGHLYFTEQGLIGDLTPVPSTQAVIAGNVALDPVGGAEAGNNPLAGQVVFLDLNNDGAFDAGDPAAVTDASGIYQIAGVAPGTYTVRLYASPGNSVTSPTGGAQSVTVAAGQNALGTPFTIVPTSVLLPLSYTTNPFGAHNPDVQTAEANGLYQTILGRAPSAPELSTAVGLLKNGTPVSAVASALLQSDEYVANYVTIDYRTYLGVNPSAADVSAWVQLVRAQGLSSEQVAYLFMTTPNFNTLHPGNPSFIQALYIDILGRQATASEVAAWSTVLAAGTTRAQAVRSLLTSPFAAQRAVDGFYSVFLGRSPDASGQAFWVAAVEAGTPLATVAASFVGGPEFVQRANLTVG